VETEAALVFAHHFSKGNKAQTDPLDRFSGSGVFGRDPDAIITMTEHSEDNCYTVQVVVRNLERPPDFVIERTFPVVKVRPDLDPYDLRGKGGRPAVDQTRDLLQMIKDEPLRTTQWQTKAVDELEISRATFNRRLKEIRSKGWIEQNFSKCWKLSRNGEAEFNRLGARHVSVQSEE
jgi:hypothetical protein